VLAPGSEDPDPTAVVLWEPGLALLERLGLRRPVETVGTALTDLACADPSRTWTGSVPGRSPLPRWRPRHGAETVPPSSSPSATPSVSTVSLDALRDQFGSLSEPLGEALAALDRSGLQYGQLPREIPGTLCADGVASVGRAAHARLPGGCLGPALSIEDGWVLADALAYGPAPVDEALAALASRAGRVGVSV
jgi:hypothetical protein